LIQIHLSKLDYQKLEEMAKYTELQTRKLISSYGGVGSIIETVEGALMIKDFDKWKYFYLIEKGKIAIAALADYKKAKKAGDKEGAEKNLALFKANYKDFGYGYYDDPHDLIPNVPLTFYSFHTMVGLGMLFVLIFILALYFTVKNKIETKRWLLWIALWSIPLGFLAQEAGWMVAEFGRQPWVVQDFMPTLTAVSNIDKTSVIITFWLFAATFTLLLIAEIKIMLKQIKTYNDGGH